MPKQSKNYIYSIGMAGMSTVLLILAVILFAPLFIFKRDIIITAGQNPFFIISIAFWFILHEMIHGFSYRMSKGITGRDIAFGAKLEKGVLFCVCKKPISKKAIIRSLLAPLTIIGFLTLTVGVVFNFELIIILSLINICGAMGDILMTLFILRMPKDMMYVEDNQNRFVIITNEDISGKKALGVKLEEIKDDIGKIHLRDLKKVTISKSSVLIIALLCLYTAMNCIA